MCLLAAGAPAVPIRAQGPRPDLAAAVAELKKYSCYEIDTGTVTRATRHLTFGCHSGPPDAAVVWLLRLGIPRLFT